MAGSALVRNADCPATAWKNGGGQTQQLLGLYLLHGEVQTEHGLMQRGDLLWGSSLAASGVGAALQLRLPR